VDARAAPTIKQFFKGTQNKRDLKKQDRKELQNKSKE